MPKRAKGERMMEIDKLTVGEAKQLAQMFCRASGAELWEVGKAYLIRTVTMTLTGRLVAVTEHELALTEAAWIAETGRYANAIETGEFVEVEPYPDGATVLVGRGAVVDACQLATPLPREQR